MPVDVSGQHRVEAGRDIRAANDVGRGREHVVARSHSRPFDALVQAEESHISADVEPSRRVQQIAKSASHGVAFGWKARQRHAHTTHLGDERPRLVENVNPRMLGKAEVWQSPALVVARDDENRDASVRDTRQGLERLIGQTRHGA